MTLLVRDEVDILESQIAFHLNAGVDFVVVTDHGSVDGTAEVLERFASLGVLHVIRESGREYRQAEWVTRMARQAASEFGADWVINADADEFWWPRGRNLKEVLAAIPARYGQVQAVRRNFVARPGCGAVFERMIARLSPSAPINDPSSPYRSLSKVIRRGSPDVAVAVGRLAGSETGADRVLAGWFPVEVLHFPLRSFEQFELEHRSRDETLAPLRGGDDVRARHLLDGRRLRRLYETYCVDDTELQFGLEQGLLTIDTRLRDLLRAIVAEPARSHPLPQPGSLDDAAYAGEASVALAADTARALGRLGALETRMSQLERSVPVGGIGRVGRRADPAGASE